MNRIICCILAFLVFAVPLFAQEQEFISETEAFLQESQAASSEESSTAEDSYNDGQSPQQRFEENPKHNVHEYDYKQQVIVGGVVMFCVALAMIANNNYNPKRGN